MIKRLLAVCAIIIITVAAQAQKDKSKQEAKYEEVSASLKKEIWAWKKPEFDVRNIPAEYNSYSTVVIARHQEIIGDSRSRSKFMIGMAAFYREMSISIITREAIKINDKSALSNYSEISFTKLENRAGMFRSGKAATYIGIRVIKPDGKIKEINADEIVQTNADKNKKEAKLAVSDLQVGDIIDYYIAQQVISDGTGYNESGLYHHNFFFYDNVPVMNYSVHIELGRKYAVEYRCYNGAPDFKVTRSDDEDIVMDVAKKNMTVNTETGLWASPLRQLPITRLNIVPGYKGLMSNKINARTPGEVYKNQNAEEFVEDRINAIARDNIIRYKYDYPALSSYEKKLNKSKDEIPADSMVSSLYYMFRFAILLQVHGIETIESVIERPRLDVHQDAFTERFGKFLRIYDIENSLVLTTSKYGPIMKEIFGNDLGYLIKTEGTKKPFFGYTDIFTPAFYVPSYYEDGKQAVTFDIKSNTNTSAKKFLKGTANIPGTTAKANARIENLKVALTTDAATLQIDRNTTLRGHYKSDVQQALISFEEYYEAERKLFGIEKSLVEDLADGKRTRKFADELSAALKLEREKQKDRFTNEAKEWFEQEVTDLSNPKLHNLGTRHYKPDFVYSASFKMGGLVKKAGNNFIIDIGKLQGSPLTLTEAQRKRTIDVYMPFARSVETTITFTIPEGFSAEGVAALNKKVENETGYFITEAAVTGNQLVIAIKKSYNHAFEPAANWDKLLAFIDAANEFTNAKILLKKK